MATPGHYLRSSMKFLGTFCLLVKNLGGQASLSPRLASVIDEPLAQTSTVIALTDVGARMS